MSFYTLIKDAIPGSSENYLRGRVIGIVEQSSTAPINTVSDKNYAEAGFVLQDESGRIFIPYGQDLAANTELPPVGAIVGVAVYMDEQRKVSVNAGFEVLVLCQTDFYIGASSPNFKRIIIDLHLKEKLIQRAKIIQAIREFFLKEGFMEVETPELVRFPGMEPYLDVFKTEFKPEFESDDLAEDRAKRTAMYLITSPEYAMKKLLVGGFEKIFQITKAFRNKETGGPTHNPEFTILEWYEAYEDYKKLMFVTQKLIIELFEQFQPGERFLKWGDHQVDIMGSWRRLTVREAFEEYAGISADVLENTERLREAALQKGYKVDLETSFDDLFFTIFLNEIEPKLGFEVPVMLCEYPLSMAALSKVCANNPKYAERFELYIAGLELCNGFSELNDAKEQARRLAEESAERIKMGKEQYPIDQSFIDALELGMPPSTGNALGVDRLIMLLTNTQDIRNVLFFPHQDL